MKRIARIAAVLALALPGLALGATSTWQIDSAHTHAIFGVRHLVITTVKGEFGKTTGTLVLDEADVTKSKVEATIDTTTVNTREPKRDEHLRSPDFFDTAKFPTMTFKSTKVEKAGEGKLKVTGDLTIRGVTKAVTLEWPARPRRSRPLGQHQARRRSHRQDQPQGLWPHLVQDHRGRPGGGRRGHHRDRGRARQGQVTAGGAVRTVYRLHWSFNMSRLAVSTNIALALCLITISTGIYATEIARYDD